jgi:hypothetical protein
MHAAPHLGAAPDDRYGVVCRDRSRRIQLRPAQPPDPSDLDPEHGCRGVRVRVWIDDAGHGARRAQGRWIGSRLSHRHERRRAARGAVLLVARGDINARPRCSRRPRCVRVLIVVFGLSRWLVLSLPLVMLVHVAGDVRRGIFRSSRCSRPTPCAAASGLLLSDPRLQPARRTGDRCARGGGRRAGAIVFAGSLSRCARSSSDHGSATSVSLRQDRPPSPDKAC